MMYVVAPISIALAIVINLIVWFNEFKQSKIITLILDLAGTFLLVAISGGGMIITAATLYASLIWSLYINNKNIPDINRIKSNKIRIATTTIAIITILIIVKAVTRGLI